MAGWQGGNLSDLERIQLRCSVISPVSPEIHSGADATYVSDTD